MPLSQCNETLLKYNKNKNLAAVRGGISDSQYCAFDPDGKKDSCEGDSGGPLQIIGNASNPTRVVGIISFGVAGCGSTIPSVYTRVASYIDWIESIVWPNNEVIPPLINHAIWFSQKLLNSLRVVFTLAIKLKLVFTVLISCFIFCSLSEIHYCRQAIIHFGWIFNIFDDSSTITLNIEDLVENNRKTFWVITSFIQLSWLISLVIHKNSQQNTSFPSFRQPIIWNKSHWNRYQFCKFTYLQYFLPVRIKDFLLFAQCTHSKNNFQQYMCAK